MNFKEFKRKLTAPLLWGNLLAMAVVIVLLVLGLHWWLLCYTNHGESVAVPDLYGMDCPTATERLEAEGLLLIVNDSAYDKRLPAGSIVQQQPQQGARVKTGRIIYVTLNSLTLSRVAIPDLVDNSSFREAQAKLQAMGFQMAPPRLIEGEKDWVYGIQQDGRNLQAGDMVARESRLTLVVGNGLNYDDYSYENDSIAPLMSVDETEEAAGAAEATGSATEDNP